MLHCECFNVNCNHKNKAVNKIVLVWKRSYIIRSRENKDDGYRIHGPVTASREGTTEL